MNTFTVIAPVAIKVYKGRDGCEAQNDIELDNGKILRIRTSKTYSGLCSSAQVFTLENGFMTTILYGDFAKRVSHAGVRCTEKNVREKQSAMVATIEALKVEVAALYEAKEKKESPALAMEI